MLVARKGVAAPYVSLDTAWSKDTPALFDAATHRPLQKLLNETLHKSQLRNITRKKLRVDECRAPRAVVGLALPAPLRGRGLPAIVERLQCRMEVLGRKVPAYNGSGAPGVRVLLLGHLQLGEFPAGGDQLRHLLHNEVGEGVPSRGRGELEVDVRHPRVRPHRLHVRAHRVGRPGERPVEPLGRHQHAPKEPQPRRQRAQKLCGRQPRQRRRATMTTDKDANACSAT